MPTIQLPKEIGNLLRTVLDAMRSRDEDDDEHTDCSCPVCRMKDFKLPVAPTGDDATIAVLGALKDVHESAVRRLRKAGSVSFDLVSSPLSAEAEDVMLQLSIDTVAAAVRAEHALSALLPAGKQVPVDLLHAEPPTIERAREILAAGRVLFQSKLDERKAEAEAKRDAKDAVDEALRAAGGK